MSIKTNSNINVSRYVAIGDSITSGYTNGALFFEGQQHAYPNLIAQQFKLIGGGDFKQPLMTKNSVGIGFYGNSKLVLETASDIENQSGPYYISEIGDLSVFSENAFAQQGPFNNMSVPSAKCTSLVLAGLGNPSNGPGNYNPFFTRMASDPSTSSVLSDATDINPTFFSVFIGNNDILTYASSGGTQDFITPVDGEPSIGFAKSIETIITNLTKNGAKGVIANLANITNVPAFNIIPFDGLVLNKLQANYLNKKYEKIDLSFTEGRNPFVIEDSSGIRQLKKGELINLDIQLHPNKELFLKAELPIPKIFILNLEEIKSIQSALNSYNQIIENLAKEKNLALVDVNSFIKTLKPEIIFNETYLKTEYKENRVFSLDGLHLNAYGQAMLANIFMKAINHTYGTKIPFLDATIYKNIK